MIDLNFSKGGGLVVAIAQDYKTKDVLMQAFINEEAWQETLKTGKAVYFSRSRNKLWRKGETSGNWQIIKDIRIDCDSDSVLFIVDQVGGAACHKGYMSCYHNKVEGNKTTLIGKPVFDPNEIYNKRFG